jgi:hypothetical protein
MIKILTILAISTVGFAADQLPPSTSNAVKVFDNEIAKAKVEYDKREDAAKKVLITALKKIQDTETKAGNLENALAIKKRIEELTPKASELMGENTDKIIIGKWKKVDNNEIIIINQDGTGKRNNDNINWSFNENSNAYIISYPDHPDWTDNIELKNNEVVMSFKSGGSVKLIKTK